MSRQKESHVKLMSSMVVAIAVICLLTPIAVRAADDMAADQARITAAGNVLQALVGADSGINVDVLNKAACVIVLPSVKKASFIVGASYGRGVMTCRKGPNFDGRWSAPMMMQSSGGSFGLQAGGQATDFVILVMNDDGARSVMKGRAKLGADASVAAGPVGRTAEASTTATMQASMLSWSRSQGVFAGVSLSGTSLGPDDNSNEKIYERKISATEIFEGNLKPPAQASELLALLRDKSPRRIK